MLEHLTFWFRSFNHLIPLVSALGILAGLILFIRIRHYSGIVIAVGGAMHLAGWCMLTYGWEIGKDFTDRQAFVISLMYPGLLISALGLLGLSVAARS